MRITQIKEADPKTAPCSISVYTKDFEARMESIKNEVLNAVKSIGDVVVERSADFA